MSQFLTGVFAGIAASTVTWSARHGIGWVLSFLQAALLKGRSVAGRWKAVYSKNGASVNEIAKLRQVWHTVWGQIENHDLGTTRTYRVRGTIRADVLVATYEIKGRRNQIDRGGFILRLNLDGNRLDGQYSWIDSQANEVMSGAYKWQLT